MLEERKPVVEKILKWWYTTETHYLQTIKFISHAATNVPYICHCTRTIDNNNSQENGNGAMHPYKQVVNCVCTTSAVISSSD